MLIALYNTAVQKVAQMTRNVQDNLTIWLDYALLIQLSMLPLNTSLFDLNSQEGIGADLHQTGVFGDFHQEGVSRGLFHLIIPPPKITRENRFS